MRTSPTFRRFLGIIGLSVDVHRFVKMQEKKRQFAVLVDWRDGPNKGLILQHPLFDKFLEDQENVPDRFQTYRLREEDLPDTETKEENYVDPLAKDPEGKEYDKHWLAKQQSVSIRDGYTGWIVIVQESYEGAIGNTLARLRSSLFAQQPGGRGPDRGTFGRVVGVRHPIVARTSPRRAASDHRRGTRHVSGSQGDSTPHTGSRPWPI